MEVNESIHLIIKKLLLEEPQRNPYKRFTILTYQLGEVGKSLRYAEIYPEERKAHLAYLKSALSDLLIQVLIMAELYGFDSNELAKLGADRLAEFRLRGKYVENE